MGRKAFIGYLMSEFVVIFAVMGLFRFIEDKQIAATIAGTLFVLLPLIMMILEYRRAGFSEKLWFVGALQFWLLFAMPIFCLRIFNWGVPFENLSIFGVGGPLLHQWSSKSYLVMMLITWWYAHKYGKIKKAG
jgi:hypothetical protein